MPFFAIAGLSRKVDQQQIRSRLKALPEKPGVYTFFGSGREIIYVGKAINLRNRVRSYFSRGRQTAKVRRLVERIEDFEYAVTASEVEALILECNLIKRHRPKYNVQLKDDKHYPYIRISYDEEWPRVYITRRFARDGARYFGPYTDSRSVRASLDLIKRLFPYRSCRQPITGDGRRPCLNFHIKRCLGPCSGQVSREEYLHVLRQVEMFLEGRHEDILRDLRASMDAAAENLAFERAAVLRDQIHSIQKVTEKQRIISTTMNDEDVVAFARSNGEACVQVLFVRQGKLIGREHFVLENTAEEDAKQILSNFVVQFYDSAAYVPPRILLQSELDEASVITTWLQDKRRDKVVVQVPRRGGRRDLVKLAEENAAEALEQMRAKWLADAGKVGQALESLSVALDLSGPPARIECYDISNIQGTSAVGSMVVFEHGMPKTGAYRRFAIKTVKGANDYAMLQEVLLRRLRRSKTDADGAKGWETLPNLLIVDGGKGQLNAALEVLDRLGVTGVVSAGLAKEREELFLRDRSEPVLLPANSEALYLVQRIRDEAHRFAITYHKQKRRRGMMASGLDQVSGIGPKRKTALLRQFGSVKRLAEASEEEIAAVPGVSRRLASELKRVL